MYNYMKKNGMKTDSKERKFTQLADTNGEFMSFSSYYLWYLMDKFHFVIDDIQTLIIFNKNTCFNSFVDGFTKNRQKAKLNKQQGKDEYCKYTLNGSYGHDAMNTDKFGQTFIQDKARTRCSIYVKQVQEFS